MLCQPYYLFEACGHSLQDSEGIKGVAMYTADSVQTLQSKFVIIVVTFESFESTLSAKDSRSPIPIPRRHSGTLRHFDITHCTHLELRYRYATIGLYS